MAYRTIDPRGREDWQFFDALGRVTKTIQNYQDGVVDTDYPDEDVTVEMTYNADGQVLTLTAKNPTTGDQTTQYVYGTTLSESAIARSDLLRAEIYPDSDDTSDPLGNGPDGVYDRVEYRYNRQGERIEKRDQNGTVHEYVYDNLGRQTEDRITTVGEGVDGAVLLIGTAYEVRGMVEKITSCRTSGSSSSSSGGSDVVNEVKLVYNDFSQLTADCQEHAGAVSLSTTPKVQYLYADGSAGHNRLEKLLYPNGRGLVHGYHSGADDAINRVSYLADESGSTAGMHLAEYAYLGLGGIVQVDYSEPDIRCDLAHGTGNDPYAGLDRFDRVVDLLWRNYGTSADAVRIQHGYDLAGNRLWREDPVAASHGVNLDELYSYDGVYQLTHRDRGDLNANRNAVTSKNFAEDWTLDMTGNWPAFKQDSDGDGVWDLDQSRTHDPSNAITQIAGSSTHVAHDRCGNMTRIPQPGDWSAHFDLVFDAWNRLVKIVDGQTIVAEYTYDGRNFRVTKTISGTVRHFYYSASWQVLEERVESSVERQNVWGLRYVDDLVLRDRNADANTETGSLGLTGSGLEERLYALQDPNWNVVAIAGSDGAIAEHYAFTAYGKPTFLSTAFANPTTSSSYSWDVLYTGRQFDPEAALYYYRNRFYGANVGRFLSEDPIGYFLPNVADEDSSVGWLDTLGSALNADLIASNINDLNLYRYVGNDPLSNFDPTGEAEHEKGERPSTKDKHEKPRPGRPTTKQRQKPGWCDRKSGKIVKCVAIGAGIGIIVGTIVEDICSGGAGILDDPACFAAGGALICAPFVGGEPDGPVVY